MTMGVGVLAWVSARQSLPLSVENKGKDTARKHQSLKYQPNTQTTRLLASLLSGCYSGWLLLVSLRQHLLLRFLVVPSSRCHSVTANRSQLNTLLT